MSKNLIGNEDYQIVTPAENGLFTVSVFNPNSPSNSGLLDDFQNVDNIPQIYIDEAKKLENSKSILQFKSIRKSRWYN